MKANIHPDYHEINILMTDGTQYKTRTTWGQAGATLRLDIDPTGHPAWTGGPARAIEGGRLAKFNQRFAGFGLKS